VTTQPGKTPEELSPRPLMRILGDFANSQILDAALEYDFFTLIHRGSQTTDEVAREAGTRPRATRIVLDGLIALALIEKKALLSSACERNFSRQRPAFLHGGLSSHSLSALGWDGLS
jgi:Dimerisation domain